MFIRLSNSRNPYYQPISVLTRTPVRCVVPKRFKQYKQNKYVRALFNADFRQYVYFEIAWSFESVCNKRKLNLIDQQRDQKKIWHSKSMRRIYAYPSTATTAASAVLYIPSGHFLVLQLLYYSKRFFFYFHFAAIFFLSSTQGR